MPRGWQKGQSGNPKGRPPGTTGPQYAPAIREMGDKQVLVADADGSPLLLTYRDAVIRKLYLLALDGNVQAAQIILDRVDGKLAPMPEPAATVPEETYDVLAEVERRTGMVQDVGR